MVLSGDLDADAEHALRAAFEAAGTARLAVDVSAVGFASCALLHVLLADRDRMVVAGEVPVRLARLFALTGTTSLFTYAPDTATVTVPSAPAGPLAEGPRRRPPLPPPTRTPPPILTPAVARCWGGPGSRCGRRSPW
ncbi:STAS domain-containing protein [Streptomyces sp. NPDC097619]|uniref:STAS domain-containing protein n=1 Tax=Streptomyces sp. NPDC097619 TaxID=3157228 RepID=UPI00331EF738